MGSSRSESSEVLYLLWADEDIELVARCKSGDWVAFEHLFRKYQARVYNMVYQLVGKLQDAEDITAEVFFKVYKHLKGYRGDSKFSTWLFKVATTTCIDEMRRRRCEVKAIHLSEIMADPEDKTVSEWLVASPEKAVDKKQLQLVVQEVLKLLSPQYQLLIMLKDVEGLSYEELSKVLNCSVNSIKVRLHRARQSFKAKFRAYLKGGEV